MESIHLVRTNLERSREIVLARIDDMRDHALVAPTPAGGCHTLWVLGHLAYIEALVVRTIMRGRSNPLERWEHTFDGAEVSYDPGDYPAFDEVLERLSAERRATIDLLGTLSEEDLDRTAVGAPKGAEALFGTYRLCLQYAADHWFMHRGQLADARRAAGLDRAWY